MVNNNLKGIEQTQHYCSCSDQFQCDKTKNILNKKHIFYTSAIFKLRNFILQSFYWKTYSISQNHLVDLLFSQNSGKTVVAFGLIANAFCSLYSFITVKYLSPRRQAINRGSISRSFLLASAEIWTHLSVSKCDYTYTKSSDIKESYTRI